MKVRYQQTPPSNAWPPRHSDVFFATDGSDVYVLQWAAELQLYRGFHIRGGGRLMWIDVYEISSFKPWHGTLTLED